MQAPLVKRRLKCSGLRQGLTNSKARILPSPSRDFRGKGYPEASARNLRQETPPTPIGKARLSLLAWVAYQTGLGRRFFFCFTTLPSSLSRLSLLPRPLLNSPIGNRSAAAAWRDVDSPEPVPLPRSCGTQSARGRESPPLGRSPRDDESLANSSTPAPSPGHGAGCPGGVEPRPSRHAGRLSLLQA